MISTSGTGQVPQYLSNQIANYQSALQRLTATLSRRELDFLEIIVIDIESMTGQDMNGLFGRVFHGYGETLWIREGKVVAQLEAFEPESEPLILAYTKKLLAEQPREPI